MVDAVVSDGQWHTLQLVKNSSATVLQVDNGQPRVIQHPTQDFGGLSVLTFSLGGIGPGPAQQKTGAGKPGQCSCYLSLIGGKSKNDGCGHIGIWGVHFPASNLYQLSVWI